MTKRPVSAAVTTPRTIRGSACAARSVAARTIAKAIQATTRARMRSSLHALDRDLVHLHGRLRTVARGGRRRLDLLDDVHARRDLAEHRVLRRARREPVEVR